MNDDKLPSEQNKDDTKSSGEKPQSESPSKKELKESVGGDATNQQNYSGKGLDKADDSNKMPSQDRSKESIDADSNDLTKDKKVENLDIKLEGDIKITEREAKLTIQLEGSKSNSSELDDTNPNRKIGTEQKIENKDNRVNTQTNIGEVGALNLYIQETQRQNKKKKTEESKFEDPTTI